MIDHDDDLSWLDDRRPRTHAPDADATTRARTALLEHADPSPALPQDGDAAPTPLPARGRRALPRILAAAAVAAVAAIAVASLLPGGDSTDGGLAPRSAEAAPLVRLSRTIQAQPAVSGDATLVRLHHEYPGEPSVDRVDLYFDDGRYYYGPTTAELHPTGVADREPGVHTQKKLAAAAAAVHLSPAAARDAIVAADSPPGFPDHMGDPAVEAKASRADRPPAKEQAAGRRTSAELRKDSERRAALVENVFWGNVVDALTAGAGRQDVRAGVMKLLATSRTVTVEHATMAGHDVLRIRETAFPDDYTETLTVDARTGVLLRLDGATAGQPPSVIVSYDVKRVTGADVLRRR